MATVTLSVPRELLRRASARLARDGREGVQEFLLSALESLALEGQPIDSETEAKLLEGLKTPLIEPDEAHLQAKLRRYDARHRKRAKGR